MGLSSRVEDFLPLVFKRGQARDQDRVTSPGTVFPFCHVILFLLSVAHFLMGKDEEAIWMVLADLDDNPEVGARALPCRPIGLEDPRHRFLSGGCLDLNRNELGRLFERTRIDVDMLGSSGRHCDVEPPSRKFGADGIFARNAKTKLRLLRCFHVRGFFCCMVA